MVMRARAQGFETLQKGGNPKDIVTSADMEVSRFLIDAIRAAFPGHDIYSEEEVGARTDAEYLWVIDPIDGSSNFSRGIPHFAVVVGLLQSGEAVCAAILNPVTNELFSFKKGGGVYLNDTPIHVSPVTDLKQSQVLLHAGRKQELQGWGGEAYRRLLGAVHKSGNLGCASLDICFVAAGRVEANVYGTLLSTLDIAPALGLLAEAGGTSSVGEKVYTANNTTILEGLKTLLES